MSIAEQLKEARAALDARGGYARAEVEEVDRLERLVGKCCVCGREFTTLSGDVEGCAVHGMRAALKAGQLPENERTHCDACGKLCKGPPPGQGGAAGYASLAADEDYAAVRICYECANVAERIRMARTKVGGHVVGYLSSNGMHFTTWTGGVLAIVNSRTTSPTGWWGSDIVRVWATSPNRVHWYGQGGGAGMVLRMKRLKS